MRKAVESIEQMCENGYLPESVADIIRENGKKLAEKKNEQGQAVKEIYSVDDRAYIINALEHTITRHAMKNGNLSAQGILVCDGSY